MIKTLQSKNLKGIIDAPSSKSLAHRMIISSALMLDRYDKITVNGISNDVKATISAINSIGGNVSIFDKNIVDISPIECDPGDLTMRVNESGTTLRLLLPVFCALGLRSEGCFVLDGELSKRPIKPLIEELTKHGVKIRQKDNKIYAFGKLTCGDYTIPGDVSSQFISGLLMALPLLNGASTLTVEGKIESKDYIALTEQVLINSGIKFDKKENKYFIKGNQQYYPKQYQTVEADWSSAAFFLCLGAIGQNPIGVRGLNENSLQGDKRIIEILKSFGAEITKKDDVIWVKRGILKAQMIDASQIPDLVPIISVVAAVSEGETNIINAQRLKFKESNRLETTAKMLDALGAEVKVTDDGLKITGKPMLSGGVTESYNDHRIAMSAAILSACCEGKVTITGVKCTDKSYPEFWNDFSSLEA